MILFSKGKYFMRSTIFMILIFLCTVGAGVGQTTEFTYQGKLSDSGAPTTTYDFEFRLCALENDCSSPLGVEQKNGVAVTGGIFTVKLNFGLLSAGDRWLEIAVKRPSESNYVTLAPRQKITSAPNAIRSLTANDAQNLGGVAANQYVLTTDPRLSGSNYVQNTSAPQPGVNFNIGGTGTANILNAATQFNLNGIRALSAPGTFNFVVGFDAGENLTSGENNAFFGTSAGALNTTGGYNSFFGIAAGNRNNTGNNNAFFGSFSGANNIDGSDNSFFGMNAGALNNGFNNSFFGMEAGLKNTTGGSNSFFGARAGRSNTIGSFNSFVGLSAGLQNTTGGGNTFVGAQSGFVNTNGGDNSFFGIQAGGSNDSGFNNSFFGSNAGSFNFTGNNNTVVGAFANLGSNNLMYAAAFGAGVTVRSSNSIVLGRSGSDNVGIGTSQALTGAENAIFFENNNGTPSNSYRIDAANNWLYIIGRSNPGAAAGAGIIFRTAPTGSGELDRVIINPDGTMVLNNLGTTGGSPLCRNASNAIAFCSSSRRYKTNIESFTGGLNLLNRLNPVSFNWTNTNQSDIGLIAEEVARVEPRLTYKNQDGEIEGVNYAQLNVVLINALKEQQAQIEKLNERNNKLQSELEALKKMICLTNAAADICRIKEEEK